MKPSIRIALALAGLAAACPVLAGAPGDDPAVARGAYLVRAGGCNDCHTPLTMGPNGPAPDTTRLLSGHPSTLEVPPPPKLGDGPWQFVATGTMTAWAGPWGVSFTANLTPDPDTGLGRWTEQDFVAMVRTGRHMGRGRPVLPPMPVTSLAALDDGDLHAIWTYLRSIPPIANRVPEPIPPAEAP